MIVKITFEPKDKNPNSSTFEIVRRGITSVEDSDDGIVLKRFGKEVGAMTKEVVKKVVIKPE